MPTALPPLDSEPYGEPPVDYATAVAEPQPEFPPAPLEPPPDEPAPPLEPEQPAVVVEHPALVAEQAAELPEPERMFLMQNVQLVLAPLDYEPH